MQVDLSLSLADMLSCSFCCAPANIDCAPHGNEAILFALSPLAFKIAKIELLPIFEHTWVERIR